MLAAIKRFLNEAAAPRTAGGAAEDELQLAAAALLFHVIAIDGVVSESERTLLTDLLSRRFGLSIEEASTLARKAENADAEAVDLYGFTSVLKRTLDIGDRERIIEMMWKLVYADGSVHEFEDNAVWRVAELLSVPTATRVQLKQKVRDSVRR
ncbi:MAG TPA: TerB family tellurite resistance protein [Bauldia sp.]|nr:TerB family tellurite resistance protein [Bauldia sp.]